MDIGIWLLSDKAVRLLMKHSYTEDGKAMKAYDLYAEFGLALGKNPRITDSELNQLSVAILPLPGGEFYHYGTSRELISSTLAVQNLVPANSPKVSNEGFCSMKSRVSGDLRLDTKTP